MAHYAQSDWVIQHRLYELWCRALDNRIVGMDPLAMDTFETELQTHGVNPDGLLDRYEDESDAVYDLDQHNAF